MTSIAIAAVAAFFVGSIPFGYLIGRAFYRTDIRAEGSGNIGAMNALRTLGKAGGAAVLLLDALKGFVPVFLASLYFQGSGIAESVVAAAAVLGHCFSPWLRWRGGKGVATSFGAIFAMSWAAGLAAVGGWITGALLTQYSSVGSMLGSALAAVAMWFFTGSAAETCYAALAALFIGYTHRENIARLQSGTENPIGLFKRR